MRLFLNRTHTQHTCQGEMKDGQFMPCFERPERVDSIINALSETGIGSTAEPEDRGLAPILAVHDREYVDFLQHAWQRWRAIGRQGDVLPLVWPGKQMRHDVVPETIDGQVGLYAFDAGSPICEGTWQAAYHGAQCAIAAADCLRSGAWMRSFSLSRPPGHHAMAAQYGGYSFINNAAVAAQWLCDRGLDRISILDIDYHHGNGSQSIFYARGDVQVINIHADPVHEYPYYLGHSDETGEGAGEGFNLNLPLPKATDWKGYQQALQQAIQAINRHSPDALILSFGADTFEGDPLGCFALTAADYREIGVQLSHLGLPTAVLLEGGYCIEALGGCVVELLQGLEPSVSQHP